MATPARTYAARRAAGLCLTCGGAKDIPGVRCEPCRDRHRRQTAAQRRRKRGRRPGLFSRCAICGEPGHNRATCGEARCR